MRKSGIVEACRDALGTGPTGRTLLAIMVGAVVGLSPLFGLHLLLCVLIARALKLNLLLTYAVANISIPPLIPLLGFASVQVGSMLLHGRWLPLGRAAFEGREPRELAQEFLLDWLAGGLVVGLALGAILCAVLLLAARLVGRAPRLSGIPARRMRARQALEEAVERYRALPPWHSWHAALKALLDPAPRVLASLVRPGEKLLDVGTGLGLLPLAVALMGEGRTSEGLDHDERRVRAATAVAAGLPCTIRLADGFTERLPEADVVALIDVLHYQDAAAREKLLTEAARAVREGGRLLVRETDARRRGLARLTRWLERVVVKLRWTRGTRGARGARVEAVAIDEIRGVLRAAGLRVHAVDLSSRALPGNVLVIGTKTRGARSKRAGAE